MKKLLLGLLGIGFLPAAMLAFVWFSLLPPTPPEPPPRGVDLTDVTVVVPGSHRLAHRRVLIEGGRIRSIEAAKPSEQDPYRGAFLMPGLTDMHVHWPAPALPGQMELFSLLYLSHGVTTVRSMGDNFPGASRAARDGIDSGRFPGPRVLSCGPFVDGDPPLWRGSQVASNPEQARDAARAIARQGFDCIKAYDGLTEETVVALREAAIEHGLPLVGHVPRRARFEVARLHDVQHLRGAHPAWDGIAPRFPAFLSAWDRADDAHFDRLVAESVHSGIAHTPTLVALDRFVASRDYPALIRQPAYSLLPRWYRDALWDVDRGIHPARIMSAEDFDMMARALEQMKKAVARLHAAGVSIHTGSDTLAPALVPGAALHRELELLVESGLTPDEALASSMVTSARFLGVDGLGEIRPGAPAELLILRRDPSRELAHLGSTLAVIRDGRLYSRDALDHLQTLHREKFEGFGQDTVLTGILRVALGQILPLLFAEGGPAD